MLIVFLLLFSFRVQFMGKGILRRQGGWRREERGSGGKEERR